jgi:hypothetical protein
MASAICIPLSSAAYTVEIDSVLRYVVEQVFRSSVTNWVLFALFVHSWSISPHTYRAPTTSPFPPPHA